MGATTRFHLGAFAVQPATLLSSSWSWCSQSICATTYADRRYQTHYVSGLRVYVIRVCIFQPDLGSGIVIASIWLGMTLVSGLSRKHLIACCWFRYCVTAAWQFKLQKYQKARILTFIHRCPTFAVRYNAYQSTIAVGSGQLTGRGLDL